MQTYNWGFSFLQLFVVTSLGLLWSVGLLVMWIKAKKQLPLGVKPEIPRGWRCVLELAETMEAELKTIGIDRSALTDRQLKKKIAKQLEGGSVALQIVSSNQKRPTLGERFKRWFKKERWWLGGLFIFYSASTLAVLSVYFFASFSFPAAPLTVYIGRTKRSRCSLAVLLSVAIVIGSIGFPWHRLGWWFVA
jgi:hypothetical protein